MATIILIEDMASPSSIGRGGLSMYPLQWLNGLERLGHNVVFIEFLDSDPKEPEPVISYFAETMKGWWHPPKSALIVESPCKSLYGLSIDQVKTIAKEAAAVITLAARYRSQPFPLIDKIRPRILVEQDPGYTHLWADDRSHKEIFGEHDFYFTVGGNIGSSRCSLPTLGINWHPIWNPVVFDWWSKEKPVTRNNFTTVADWRSYGYLEFGGQILGPKAEEFRKFIDLPKLVGESLEIVLNIDPSDPDIDYLKDNGWKIESPQIVSSPALYHDYVTSSIGEFSCVKGGYAGTHCGWFSDRSACFLAAGRPVILQATGFEDLLPTGKGLFAVSTVTEAVEAVKVIKGDYTKHSVAARDIAIEHLNSDKIILQLLSKVGI